MVPTLEWQDDKLIIKNNPTHKVWAEMERLVEIGLVRSIGVSNCTVPILIDILSYCKIKPVTNQIELHPYLVQKDLVDFHKKLDVTVTAYAPLGAFTWPFKREEHKSLNVLRESIVTDLAAKYGKGTGQVILNWHLHRGHIIIPKTSKIERLRENIQVYDFKMTDEEYDSISKLDKKARFYDPVLQSGFGWNLWPYFDA